jgi:hypothetical protein
MATVIDQLVVKLSLDDVEFLDGEKRVAASLGQTKKKTENVGKNIAADGKKGAEFFGQLEKAALKFFAVLTTGRGLADFTRTVIATGAAFDRASKNLDVGADTLSRWAGAVRQSGGTTESFLGTMQGLSQSLTELKLTGNTGILPYLQALGVSVSDTNGKAKPLESILGDIGDKLNKLPNRQDAFNIGRNLGIDDGTINLLLKGRTEVERLLASQKAYSAADAESARKAQERWGGVQLRIERITQKLVIDLIPAFERLSNKMEELANTSVPVLREIFDWIDKIDRITTKWTQGIDNLLPKFSNPTLQKLFGGYGGTAARVNPLTNIAGGVASGGQKITEFIKSDAVSKEDRGVIKGWTERLLDVFGMKPRNGSQQPPMTAPATTPGTGRTRAERNNNPGNLNFAGQAGATLEEGSNARFAKFGSTGRTRAERNNNPGNLNFAGQSGATLEDGSNARFAKFGSTGRTRAERNNNPGNLNFAGQAGATLEERSNARFAKFGSTAEGVSALAKQLQRYGERGLDTVSKIINKYAPSSENNTQAYIDALSKRLGVSGDQRLDLSDSNTLTGLIKGIARHEAGSDYLSDSDVMTGLSMAGVKGGSGQQAPNLSIGEVKVYTQATDANGIARDMRGAIIQQANTGVR